MPQKAPEGRGPVRYGPPAPDTGLPVPPVLAGLLSTAAGRAAPEPDRKSVV